MLQRQWNEQAFSSPSFWLGLYIPASVICCVALYDGLNLLNPFRSIFRFVAVPFSNFITLEDLREPIGKLSRPARWKIRTLRVLCLVEVFAWVATLVFSLTVHDAMYSIRAGASALLWVRQPTRHFYVELKRFPGICNSQDASETSRLPSLRIDGFLPHCRNSCIRRSLYRLYRVNFLRRIRASYAFVDFHPTLAYLVIWHTTSTTDLPRNQRFIPRKRAYSCSTCCTIYNLYPRLPQTNLPVLRTLSIFGSGPAFRL